MSRRDDNDNLNLCPDLEEDSFMPPKLDESESGSGLFCYHPDRETIEALHAAAQYFHGINARTLAEPIEKLILDIVEGRR